MKRGFLITLLVCLTSVGASAQWYLFPGKPTKRDSTKTEHIDSAGIKDTQANSIRDLLDQLFSPENRQEKESIGVTLILPLNVKGNPSSNFLEFYSGALLAAKDLAESGMKLELNVFDLSDPLNPPDNMVLEQSDVIIGPVAAKDLEAELLVCPAGKYLVSPLDPKAIGMVSSFNLIQAPTPWERQAEELVRWLSEEISDNDRLILLQNESEEAGEAAPFIVGELNGSGIDYTITGSAEGISQAEGGCLRFILVSDNDSFCSSKVREIALLAAKGNDVALYSNSKLRSVADIDSGSLHLCNSRITANYYADSSDPAVRRFTSSYIGMFSAEPGSFAYQGYDIVHYFASARNVLGEAWENRLHEYREEGLQTGFVFMEDKNGGRANTAVRRLRYRGDNVITIEK